MSLHDFVPDLLQCGMRHARVGVSVHIDRSKSMTTTAVTAPRPGAMRRSRQAGETRGAGDGKPDGAAHGGCNNEALHAWTGRRLGALADECIAGAGVGRAVAWHGGLAGDAVAGRRLAVPARARRPP